MTDPPDESVDLDGLVERLRGLPAGLADPGDRFEQVSRRVRRRRRVRVVVAGLGVVVVLAVAVPAGLARTSGSLPGPPTNGLDTNGVSAGLADCPKVFGGAAPWVPALPTGIGTVGDSTAGQMAPSERPSSAVICWYRRATPPGRKSSDPKLSGQRALTGGLTQLAVDLSWLPRRLPGQRKFCTMVGSPYEDDYLVQLSYPGGGKVWVSTDAEPNECADTSNGAYLSPENVGAQVAASYAARAWVPAPPPAPGSGYDACEGPALGRRGQETEMVPAQPVSVRVCDGGLGRATNVGKASAGFADLVRLLNSLPTKTSSLGCSYLTSVPPRGYELRFHYAVGPDVSVRVQPGCAPAVDNNSRSATDGAVVATLIAQLVARQH
jgi:hypothetical protein